MLYQMNPLKTQGNNIFKLGILCNLLFVATLAADTNRQLIGAFSKSDLVGWEEEVFSGKTLYEFTLSSDKKVLKATSKDSASGLYKKVTIDLEKTPYLNWSWRIENTYEGNNEREKSGDDYPARIYVVVSGGIFFWKTRALNYVWSSQQAVNSHWPNAYTDNAHMLAIRSGQKEAGQWHIEKRNVRNDLKQFFGKDIRKIHAIALMTDSDNSGQGTTAYYGDIYFSAD